MLDIQEGVVLAASGEHILTGQGRPVGSIMKIFAAYALLSAGGSGEEVFYCAPSFPEIPATSSCWYRPGHGNMTLKTALANSCNAYFRQWLAGKPLVSIEEFLQKLILIEASLPEDQTEKRMAVLGLSPMIRPKLADLVSAAASLFNGGILFHITRTEAGERCAPLRSIAIDSGALEVIRLGMRESAIVGTGKAAQNSLDQMPLLTKTGTSAHLDDNGIDNSRTDGYCLVLFPADDPRYLLFVFAPDAQGADQVAYAAGQIIKVFIEGIEN